jgi:hypothetical protein
MFRIVPLTLSTLQMYSISSWHFSGLPGYPAHRL